MKPIQRERIIQRQRHALDLYGMDYRALSWRSREGQLARFRVLREIGIENHTTVLDVGCGFGDFKHYLDKQQLEVDYHGIDVSPELIELARAHTPSGKFHCGDIFEYDPDSESVDFVIISGVLAEPMGDQGYYVQRLIQRCYKVCRKGVAFNALNSDEHPNTSLQTFSPKEVSHWIQRMGATCSQRQGYLPGDFTCYIYK